MALLLTTGEYLATPEQQALLALRSRWPAHVAGLHGWASTPDSDLCQWSNSLRLYNEKLSFQLRDLEGLPEERALQIIEESALGFLEISRASGITPNVRDDMVFFDLSDRTKVWLSPSLADFTPPYGC